MNNYPPGMMTGRGPTDYAVPQTCPKGHVWTTPMFSELGGGFYVDEENGPVCPSCGSLDLGDPELAEKRLEAARTSGTAIQHVGPEEPRELGLFEPDGPGFYRTRGGEIAALTHQDLRDNWKGSTPFYSSTWWHSDGRHNMYPTDDIVRKMG